MATRIKTDEGIAKDVVDSLDWDSRVDARAIRAISEEYRAQQQLLLCMTKPTRSTNRPPNVGVMECAQYVGEA